MPFRVARTDTALRHVADLAVRRRCGGCGDALGAPAWPVDYGSWCAHCVARWGPVPGWWPGSPAACDTWAAAAYRGPVRRSILAAKRGAGTSATELLLHRWPAGLLPAEATITWVPAHPWRAGRSTDATRTLAVALAGRDARAARPLLVRSPLGRRQAGRPDDARRREPERLGLRVRTRVSGPVVLVDDVRTTGTTLGHAAALLREAGASSVVALTVAATAGH